VQSPMKDSVKETLLQNVTDLTQDGSQFNVMSSVSSVSHTWAISSQKFDTNMDPIVRGYGAMGFCSTAIMYE